VSQLYALIKLCAPSRFNIVFTPESLAMHFRRCSAEEKQRLWPCPSCNRYASSSAIMCDCYLLWFHKEFVSLKKNKGPKATY
jgi:hypothetical protein